MTTISRRRFALFSGALLSLPTTVSYASDESSPQNGYWWNDIPPAFHLGYACGFVAGTTVTTSMWKSFWKAFINDDPKAKASETSKELATTAADIYNFSNTSYGQLSDGLDEFYKDFRNMRIHVDDAIGYVKDQIHGNPSHELEKELSLMRKVAATDGYDR